MDFTQIPQKPKGVLAKPQPEIKVGTGTAVVHTDGSVEPNPGYAGWGCVIQLPGDPETQEWFGPLGDQPDKTNNDAELEAMCQGLEHVAAAGFVGDVVIRSDSQWALYCAVGEWRRKAAKFIPMWRRLDDVVDGLYAAGCRVVYQWVKGHAGHPLNERADRLANQGRLQASDGQGPTSDLHVAGWEGWVTVYSDASWGEGGGAYGLWLKSDWGCWVGRDKSPPWVHGSNCAEMDGLYAGMRIAMQRWGHHGVVGVLFCCDSQTALRWARGEGSAPKRPHDVRMVNLFRAWRDHYGIRIRTKWVRGHQDPNKSTAAYLNDQTDRLANAARKA